MSKDLKHLYFLIKDLEAELDYYYLYEPDDIESMERIRVRIVNVNHEYDDLKKRIDKENLDGVRESSFSK